MSADDIDAGNPATVIATAAGADAALVVVEDLSVTDPLRAGLAERGVKTLYCSP